MAVTKTKRTIVASTASSTATSGTLNVTAAQGGTLVTASVLNGATPPTTGCLITFSTSADNTDYYVYDKCRAGVAASTQYDIPRKFGPEVMYIKVEFGATSQTVTKVAIGQEYTTTV